MLRVHTDDALRISTTTTASSCARTLRPSGVNVGTITVTSPTSFRVEGVPQDRDAEFRRAADEQVAGQLRPQPRRRRQLRLHDEAEHRARPARADRRCRRMRHDRSPRQRARAWPSRTSRATGSPAIRSWCSCPASTEVDARQGNHPLDRAARVEAGRSRTVVESRGAAAGARRQGAGRHGDRHRSRRAERWLARRSTSSARWRRSPGRICATRGRRSTRTTGRRSRFTLDSEGARKFGKVTGENIGRYLAIILDNRVQSAPRIEGADHR